VIVGTVEIHQAVSDAFQGLKGGRLIVEGDAPGTVGLERTADDEPMGIIAGQIQLLEERRSRRGVGEGEDGFHLRSIGAGPDEGFIGAFAQEEGESSNEDGLAGSGFTGEYVEARAEFDGQLFDKGQMSNPERFQHGRHGTMGSGRRQVGHSASANENHGSGGGCGLIGTHVHLAALNLVVVIGNYCSERRLPCGRCRANEKGREKLIA